MIKFTSFQRRVRAFGDTVPVQIVAQRVFADSVQTEYCSTFHSPCVSVQA